VRAKLKSFKECYAILTILGCTDEYRVWQNKIWGIDEQEWNRSFVDYEASVDPSTIYDHKLHSILGFSAFFYSKDMVLLVDDPERFSSHLETLRAEDEYN